MLSGLLFVVGYLSWMVWADWYSAARAYDISKFEAFAFGLTPLAIGYTLGATWSLLLRWLS